ncbi:MAG: HD domain-containing protein [Acholeplasmatales bacterium]|nr:HD domain-containing protein [Acholeplasmatales bacterium]
MFEKLKRTKVFRDPLYGYIQVDYKIISDLIDSREVQRLRRIRQLSGVSMVFQTAEHTRFTHSLGAYQMANLVLQNVDGIEVLDEYKSIIFLCAALLHDVGHGPYSHAFESVMNLSHEEMTVKIILSPDTEINKILSQYENLATDIASVIAHDNRFPLLEALVSSQLDVDRMDYLSRDAYFTGAAYGHIDYYRILRSMKIVNNKLCVRASGVHSIESYLMSRYHMYFQVYYHPIARSYESLLENIYRRVNDLVAEGKKIDAPIEAFLKVINNNCDVESYIDLDDAYVNGFIKQFTKSSDDILRKLSLCLINRHLYRYIDLADDPDPEEIEAIKSKYSEDVLKYYYLESKVEGVAYSIYKKTNINDIKVLLPNGKIKSLEQYSPIVKSLSISSLKTVNRIYYLED